jgi:hypothetical protein
MDSRNLGNFSNPKGDFQVVCTEGIARALCRVGKGQPIIHMRRIEGDVSDT